MGEEEDNDKTIEWIIEFTLSGNGENTKNIYKYTVGTTQEA